MNQSSQTCPTDRNKRITFIVVGGVFACATALATVLSPPDVLRGDQSHSDDRASLDGSLFEAPLIAKSKILPIPKPAQQLRKNPPTTYPPTTDEDVHIATATRKLNLFVEEVPIRLKLYWQLGYTWQEKTEETW